MGEKAYLTIKGIGNSTGVSRFEWEQEIDSAEAAALLKIAEPGVISKTRYFIPSGNHTIELDIFEDDNAGLIIAEVELNYENEPFNKPDWFGNEVTGDKRYYNSALAKNPWKSWNSNK
jgi:adenylate cyclase